LYVDIKNISTAQVFLPIGLRWLRHRSIAIAAAAAAFAQDSDYFRV
jgi:hypothetical protein